MGEFAPILDKKTRGLSLHDAWIRRAITLVGVENYVARGVSAAFKHGASFAAARLGALRGDPAEWKIESACNMLAYDLHRTHAALSNHIAGVTGELAGRWFGCQARTLLKHIHPRQHGKIRDHLATLAFTAKAPITEARRKPVTISVNLDPADILGEMFRQLGDRDMARYLKGASASFFQKGLATSVSRAINQATRELQRGQQTKSNRRRLLARIKTLLGITRDRIEGVARTHVQTVAFDTEEMLLQYVGPAITRVRYTAILDSRTCLICGKHAGKIWRVKDPARPLLPIHRMCRCWYLPLLRGSPPPPATETFADFLARQKPERQRVILGATRYELYRQGVPVERFVNRLNHIIPIDRLPEPGHVPKSWKR